MMWMKMITSSNLKLLRLIILKILLKLKPLLNLTLKLKIVSALGLRVQNPTNNCLQLTFTASLHPVMDHATRDSKYKNNLIEPRQQH